MTSSDPKLQEDTVKRRKRSTAPKFIVDGSYRAGTFKNRKPTLQKKAQELQILCGIEVCMVCIDSNGETITWPKNRSEVCDVVNKYRGLGGKAKRKVELLGFFASKKRKLEEKVNKGKEVVVHEVGNKKGNIGNMFPNWEAELNKLSEEEVVGLINKLEYKLNSLKERIQMEKKKVNEKAKQVVNNGKNHSNMENQHCFEPLMPYDLLNQQGSAFAQPAATWASSGNNGSNLSWKNSVLGKCLANSQTNNLLLENKLSMGFGDQNMGYRGEENLHSMGESSNINSVRFGQY